MRVINNREFSNLEINVLYLRDVRHISSAIDMVNYLNTVNLEEIENLLELLDNCNIKFG